MAAHARVFERPALQVLNDLDSTKSLDGKTTLLHHLAERTAGAAGSGKSLAAQLKEEMPSLCQGAIRFEWSQVASEVAGLDKSIKNVKSVVDTDKVEAFVAGMTSFVETAEKQRKWKLSERNHIDRARKLILAARGAGLPRVSPTSGARVSPPL